MSEPAKGLDPNKPIKDLFDRFQACLRAPLDPSGLSLYLAGPQVTDPDSLVAITKDVEALDKFWPGQGAVYLLKGHLAMQQNNLDGAIKAYELAVQGQQGTLTNDGYECMFALGAAYFKKGNYAAATEAFGQCAKDKPDNYGQKVNGFYQSIFRPTPFISGVVQVFTQAGIGTGFLVAEDGQIITCAHVVKTSKTVMVRFYGDTKMFHCNVLKIDIESDLGLIKLIDGTPKNVRVQRLGSSEGKVGRTVYAFGFPMGFGTWAKGEVIGLIKDMGDNVLQIKSSEITHGFSGGPIWEESLQSVIGVGVSIMYPVPPAWRLHEVAFAIPVEEVKRFLDSTKAPEKSAGGSPTSSDHCFIATAAFGTINAPDVIALRQFRDTYLSPIAFGRWMIRRYYQFSPPIAKFIASRPILKKIIRQMIHFCVTCAGY